MINKKQFYLFDWGSS